VFSLSHLRSQLRQVLHLNESPHRTALAFAVGAFIAFSPTYGFHTLSVFFVAWAARLNVAAVLAGSLINNPWTVVPILGATLWTGFLCLGAPQVPAFTWNDLSAMAIYRQIIPYAVPFFIGGLVLSILAAALGYVGAYGIILHYRKRLNRMDRSGHPLPPETR
jgi:uncharacterized protein (DUF2062 family)